VNAVPFKITLRVTEISWRLRLDKQKLVASDGRGVPLFVAVLRERPLNDFPLQKAHVPAVCEVVSSGSNQTFSDSIARTISRGSARSRLAKSCFMCSLLDVPVNGSIPTMRAKLNTTWAGVAFTPAAKPAIRRW
jgi:hypothetical protein